MTTISVVLSLASKSSLCFSSTAGGDHLPRRADLPLEHDAGAGGAVAAESAGEARAGTAGRPGHRVRHGAGLPSPPPPLSGAPRRRRCRASGRALRGRRRRRGACLKLQR
jgi:hypothetical protein